MQDSFESVIRTQYDGISLSWDIYTIELSSLEQEWLLPYHPINFNICVFISKNIRIWKRCNLLNCEIKTIASFIVSFIVSRIVIGLIWFLFITLVPRWINWQITNYPWPSWLFSITMIGLQTFSYGVLKLSLELFI